MKRVKHKIKREVPEASTSRNEEHDLAYYIHDRVELMHQVFSVLKHKDLKAMAPECVRKLSIDDLQELCLEELLGISSKRLCATLDGAEPPSDTESSSQSVSPQQMETISLDSISSDEEILSEASKKSKKHKHHRKSKTKHKRKKSKDVLETEETDKSRASRAGLTVLELLELQARARAIRAQLQNEQVNKPASETAVAESSHHSSENEVEIKEEPAEVVEISSEDEKPNVKELKKALEEVKQPEQPTAKVQSVTKKINDLIITVPQTQPSRKIKLHRNKVSVSMTNVPAEDNNIASDENAAKKVVYVTTSKKAVEEPKTSAKITTPPKVSEKRIEKSKVKTKKKLKKKEKKQLKTDKEGSDHDEITLQLSDSEKLDLLEDLDRKNFDNVTSSSSADSESSSSDSDSDNAENSTNNNGSKEDNSVAKSPEIIEKVTENVIIVTLKKNPENDVSKNKEDLKNNDNNSMFVENVNSINDSKTITTQETIDVVDTSCATVNIEEITTQETIDVVDTSCATVNIKEITTQETIDVVDTSCAIVNIEEKNESLDTSNNSTKEEDNKSTEVTCIKNTSDNSTNEESVPIGKPIELTCIEDIPVVEDDNVATDKETYSTPTAINKESTHSNKDKGELENQHPMGDDKKSSTDPNTTEIIEKHLSEGEISEQSSSEIEAVDIRPEVVCISDEEANKSAKKKKKKEKKAKKEKKTKKTKSDFLKSADQNFYRDSSIDSAEKSDGRTEISNPKVREDVPDDDVYEILELSDDSSCYEVEGVSVLSKEPTAEEIEALSAKIDEMEREEVVTEEQIKEHERQKVEKTLNAEEELEIENISWKDRYLGSKKVKRVLTTANIINAIRKKNKELKKKLEDSKKKEVEVETEIEKAEQIKPVESNLEEGSIEHYNTLLGSTKYVDPVLEDTVNIGLEKDNVTKEMKKDAKQLLKMYKRLLKYNDMNKPKDPNKKKKKQKKNKQKENASVAKCDTKTATT